MTATSRVFTRQSPLKSAARQLPRAHLEMSLPDLLVGLRDLSVAVEVAVRPAARLRIAIGSSAASTTPSRLASPNCVSGCLDQLLHVVAIDIEIAVHVAGEVDLYGLIQIRPDRRA